MLGKVKIFVQNWEGGGAFRLRVDSPKKEMPLGTIDPKGKWSTPQFLPITWVRPAGPRYFWGPTTRLLVSKTEFLL